MSEEKPWDVKELRLYLGGEKGDSDFITFTVFDDNSFNMCEGDPANAKWFYEDIDVDAAKRLRDFLNYAIPK